MTNTEAGETKMAAVVVATEYVSMDEVTHKARELGKEEGTAAGSWVFDGNTDQESYENALRWDEEGDPMYDEYYGAGNPLSGEWADSRTPKSLIDELGYINLTPEEEDEVATAYEESFRDAHRDEVLRVARAYLD